MTGNRKATNEVLGRFVDTALSGECTDSLEIASLAEISPEELESAIPLYSADEKEAVESLLKFYKRLIISELKSSLSIVGLFSLYKACRKFFWQKPFCEAKDIAVRLNEFLTTEFGACADVKHTAVSAQTTGIDTDALLERKKRKLLKNLVRGILPEPNKVTPSGVVGTVTWFNNSKGWGFVRMEDGTEAFVHYSDVGVNGFKALFVGDIVTFEPAPKGLKAENVHRK
jgi:CspA family cold shock protein